MPGVSDNGVALSPSLVSQRKGGVGTEQGYSNLVSTLVGSRKHHVQGRKASGIEEDWIEDEEHYQGIDDANRGTMRSWILSIKRGMQAQPDVKSTRSSVFLNITGPYVDSASARVADMLIPVDDRCWELKPTPVPELSPILMRALGAQNSADLTDKLEAAAEAAAQGMEKAIDDKLVECGWHAEVRKLIEDSARIGTGIMKGPFPILKRRKTYTAVNGIYKMDLKSDITVASKCISAWNFFPDPACGENIHNGNGCWERDYITERMLLDMVGLPGYNAREIGRCMKEGPTKHAYREQGNTDYVPIDDQFQRWTFYGRIPCNQAQLAGIPVNDPTVENVDIMAVLVNDHVLKVETNVMDTGEFPYDVMAWRTRPGVPWGVGISRQVRTAQRILNGAARALMDNAGASAGMQIIMKDGVRPADGRIEIHRPKLWLADENVDDVTKAFYCFMPESRQAELMEIIQFALRMGEETTGLPLLLQGQQGEASQTVGGMQMLQNNASGTLRRLAKRYDDFLTAPHIERYFDWEMQYGKDQSIKGDCQIEVRASSALVAKDAQKQFLFASSKLAENPKFGINPYNLFKQLSLAERMDPKSIQYTEEEFKKQSSAPPSPVEQSQIELNQSKTLQAKATAAETNVNSLFGAANTAAVLATNPALAPAADAVARSAGVQDADAPPLEPNVGGTPAPIPLASAVPKPLSPLNTHPNFPPHATAGAQTGIEGGHP